MRKAMLFVAGCLLAAMVVGAQGCSGSATAYNDDDETYWPVGVMVNGEDYLRTIYLTRMSITTLHPGAILRADDGMKLEILHHEIILDGFVEDCSAWETDDISMALTCDGQYVREYWVAEQIE